MSADYVLSGSVLVHAPWIEDPASTMEDDLAAHDRRRREAEREQLGYLPLDHPRYDPPPADS